MHVILALRDYFSSGTITQEQEQSKYEHVNDSVFWQLLEKRAADACHARFPLSVPNTCFDLKRKAG